MCGLAVAALSPRDRSGAELARIWDIFTQNLIQNEERGREATGVGVVQSDGSRRLWKLPVPATEFVQTPDYGERAREAFNNQTVCLLGHTRKPTKGEVGHSNNNHPIVTKYVIGIHNGEIKNDDDLFGEYSMPRNGQVDSEAIFALLDTVPVGLKPEEYKKRIISLVDQLSGRLTTVSMDMRRPLELLVLKRDMPFSMHYEAPLNTLFFSSRYVFLRKAFGRSVVTEALPTKQGFIFRLNEFDNLEDRYSDTFPLERK